MKRTLAAVASLIAVSSFAATPPLETDRAKALAYLAENVYGVRPSFDGFVPKESVTSTDRYKNLAAIAKTVEINVPTPIGEKTFRALGLFPAEREKSPVFVYISFGDPWEMLPPPGPNKCCPGRWPVKDILGRGFATVAFDYQSVLPDRRDVLNGVKRPENGWGAISTWALAASRVCDYLQHEELADTNRLAIIGLSRLGKTALWCGANDTRFAYVISACSGCLGARATTRNVSGETIDRITANFPHWFAPACRTKFAGHDENLPFDQHWLLAAVAPRLLAVSSAEDDYWACPSGEFAAWELSRPAWGEEKRNTHYRCRPGPHDVEPGDWKDYMDFATARGWRE